MSSTTKDAETPGSAVTSAERVEVQPRMLNSTTSLSGAADTSAETTELQLSATDSVAASLGAADTSAKRVETRPQTPDAVATLSPPSNEVGSSKNLKTPMKTNTTTTSISIRQINQGGAHIANLSTDQITSALGTALGPKSAAHLRKHRDGAIAFINTT